jgi:hypothetical protein
MECLDDPVTRHSPAPFSRWVVLEGRVRENAGWSGNGRADTDVSGDGTV